MGINAVCHTLNPRLFEADLEFIINHAEVEGTPHLIDLLSWLISNWHSLF